MIIILCGQPHSGKTTIAKHLKTALELSHPFKKVFNIDGDNLRDVLKNKDYSREGRIKNITTAHSIAKYLHLEDYKNDVIISLVSPFRDLREDLKNNFGAKEFFIHTTEIRGREEYHVKDFEAPLEKFIDVDTTNDDEITTINFILENLKQQ